MEQDKKIYKQKIKKHKARRRKKTSINKFKFVIFLLLILLIFGIIVRKNISMQNSEKNSTNKVEEIKAEQEVKDAIEIKNFTLNYLSKKNKTVLILELTNTKNITIENRDYTLICKDKENKEIGRVNININYLESGNLFRINKVIENDFSSTNSIEILK